MSKRIRWDADEVELVAGRAFFLRLQDPTPGLLAIIDRAQADALPAGRRRPLKHLGSVRNVVASVEARLATLAAGGPAHPPPTAQDVAAVCLFLLQAVPGSSAIVQEKLP